MSAYLGGLASGGMANGSLTVPSGTLSIGNNNTNTNFKGTLTGTTALFDKIGTGVSQLGGTNTYSGPTVVSGGAWRPPTSLEA